MCGTKLPKIRGTISRLTRGLPLGGLGRSALKRFHLERSCSGFQGALVKLSMIFPYILDALLKEAHHDFSSCWFVPGCSKYTPLLTNGRPSRWHYRAHWSIQRDSAAATTDAGKRTLREEGASERGRQFSSASFKMFFASHSLEHEQNCDLGIDALVTVCSWNTNVTMVWAWGCSWKTNRIVIWAWMLLELEGFSCLGMDSLVITLIRTRTELRFGHGCSRDCMLLEHEGYYSLGKVVLLAIRSWNTNVTIWAWMLS